MLELHLLTHQAQALGNYTVAKLALIYGPKDVIWHADTARQYNRLWIAEHAQDFAGVPGIEQEALCAECSGICLILGVIREDGRQVVHECRTCSKCWGVPIFIYTGGISK